MPPTMHIIDRLRRVLLLSNSPSGWDHVEKTQIFPWLSCEVLDPFQYQHKTRRPASADRTARRKFQATGQPVSRTQASDAMTSRLPRYEAKCVHRRRFKWESVPLRSDIKGTVELPLPIYWYHSKGNWLRYNLAADSFYIMKLCSRLLVLFCRNLNERRQI